jgi:hypothetical protein
MDVDELAEEIRLPAGTVFPAPVAKEGQKWT